MPNVVQYLSPDGLHRNPAFSQLVVIDGPAKMIHVGGQNAVDASGQIVGRGDLAAQAEQACKNVATALTAAGAGPEHMIKTTIYIVQGHDLRSAFAVAQRVWGRLPEQPAISVLVVAGLAHPDFLIEIDAIAAVPGERR